MAFLISIIVPVYNVENYIDRCVLSLINQTHKYLEIILVNDGSTDQSGAICDYYASKDKRIKVFHVENGGSSIARNYGLKNCTGDYIGFVDSDDWILPNMYSQLLEFAIINNLKVVETNSIDAHLVDQQKISQESIKAKVEEINVSLKRIIRNKTFGICTRLYHNSILKNRYFIEGILHQDVYYTIDILNEISQIGYFENSYYLRNVKNPSSVTRSPYSKKKLDSIGAAEYVVENTKHYDMETHHLACQYLFQFLNYHYDALYLNYELDKNKTYRKKIRQTIKKYHNLKNSNFYTCAIIYLPGRSYKIFLFTNKIRMKIKFHINKYFRNV